MASLQNVADPYEISLGQTSRIGAKIGAGLGNVGAEAWKSGAEVENRGRSQKLWAACRDWGAAALCTQTRSNNNQISIGLKASKKVTTSKATKKMRTKNRKTSNVTKKRLLRKRRQNDDIENRLKTTMS